MLGVIITLTKARFLSFSEIMVSNAILGTLGFVLNLMKGMGNKFCENSFYRNGNNAHCMEICLVGWGAAEAL